MLGDTSYEVAFAWLVLAETGSPATLGAVLLSTALPCGLLLLVGGAITDRFSPRTIMVASHLARGAFVSGLTVLVATGALQTWHFYAVGTAVGAAEAFFWPASTSIVPSLVSSVQLSRANALLGVAEQVSRLAGPVLGGALMAWPGPATALGFNAATFAVAAGTALAAPRRSHQRRASGTNPGADADTPDVGIAPVGDPNSIFMIWDEIRSGLSYAGRNTEVRIVLLLVAAATLSYSGLFGVGLPALSREFDDGTGGDGTRGQGSVVLGVMVSAWGLGQLVGAVAASITGLPRRWGLLIIGMSVAEGTSFAVLGLIPQYLLASGLLAVLGVGVAYSTDVALPTFVQSRTPPDMLGRVNSVLDLPRFALAPVSMALMGVLAAVDVRLAFAAAAVPMLVAGLALAASPTARQLRTDPPPPSPVCQ